GARPGVPPPLTAGAAMQPPRRVPPGCPGPVFPNLAACQESAMTDDATSAPTPPRARRPAAIPAAPAAVAVGAALLARSASQTLAEQLAGHYAARIRQRLLLPGARLPSVRESARRHRVSPSTVVAAYDQLLAQGLV